MTLAFVLTLGVHYNTNAQGKKADAPKASTTQTKRSPESVAQKNTDKIAKLLSLSADQKTKTYAACLNAATKVHDARTKFEQNKDAKALKASNKSAKEGLQADMKAFLNADQYKKLNELAKKKEDGRKGKGKKGKGGSGKGKAEPKGKAGDDNDEDDLF